MDFELSRSVIRVSVFSQLVTNPQTPKISFENVQMERQTDEPLPEFA